MSTMTHSAAPPFAHSSGPRDARIALVGEAFGEQEDLTGLPFIGASGQELSRLLREAGLERSEVLLTNVLALRPFVDAGNGVKLKTNDFAAMCCGREALPDGYAARPLRPGLYLRPEFLPEVNRLYAELQEVRPNLVICLGGTALWALTGSGAIGTLRGTIMSASGPAGGHQGVGGETVGSPLKVLPTYHPSYLFKQWSHRPVVLADLMKAKHEAQFPEIRRPSRRILVSPTLQEVRDWVFETLQRIQPPMLAVDIETARGQITMIGFARSREDALVVPFVFPWGESWWEDIEDELHVRALCQELLASAVPKVFQNGLYDIQWLMDEGFELRSCAEDTMLLHHSLYPELQKGLGFLGSIYSSEPAWKLMRGRGNDMEFKRDE